MSGLVVLAGRHRGRRLEVPPVAGVRPTAVRVRKSLFDLLAHSPRVPVQLEGASVLDLFAGSGALGLEALSRGAEAATFIEQDAAVAAALARNIAALGEEARARVLTQDARQMPVAAHAADIVFVDAPYGTGLAGPVLDGARQSGWMAAGGVAVVELGRREAFTPPQGFRIIDERASGTTRTCVLQA